MWKLIDPELVKMKRNIVKLLEKSDKIKKKKPVVLISHVHKSGNFFQKLHAWPGNMIIFINQSSYLNSTSLFWKVQMLSIRVGFKKATMCT